MPKSPAERKAAQRARQSASGERKLELVLDSQELDMLTRNCVSRRPGRDPYDMAEYVALLIRQDDARFKARIKSISKRCCDKCGDRLPVQSCIFSEESKCWVRLGWCDVRLIM